MSYEPPPSSPISTPKPRQSSSYHWFEQIDRRGDDQRWPPHPLDRHVGQMRLAGSGRQHDHSAAALLPPGLERLDLMRKRFLGHLQPPLGRLVSPGSIDVRSLFAAQVLDNRTIPDRLGAQLTGARVKSSRRASRAPRPLSGPSTISVPASKSRRSGELCPLVVLTPALMGAIAREEIKLGRSQKRSPQSLED